MRILLLLLVFAAAAAVRPAQAKGNDGWVLTGGELGEYAMGGVTAPLIEQGDTDTFTAISQPGEPPSTWYGLYGSSSEFASIYEAQHGGPWVRYYPEMDALEFVATSAAATSRWYRPSPAVSQTLRDAIARALAAKAQGELESSPVAAELRARSMDKMHYRVTGLGEIPPPDTERFVMSAVVETVRQPPAAVAPRSSAHTVVFSGEDRPGNAIGGTLGFYAPPGAGQPGRFWIEDDGSGGPLPYYATTQEFDEIVAEGARAASGAPVVAAESGGSHRSAIAVGAGVGLWLMLALGAAAVAVRRRSGA